MTFKDFVTDLETHVTMYQRQQIVAWKMTHPSFLIFACWLATRTNLSDAHYKMKQAEQILQPWLKLDNSIKNLALALVPDGLDDDLEASLKRTCAESHESNFMGMVNALNTISLYYPNQPKSLKENLMVACKLLSNFCHKQHVDPATLLDPWCTKLLASCFSKFQPEILKDTLKKQWQHDHKKYMTTTAQKTFAIDEHVF